MVSLKFPSILSANKLLHKNVSLFIKSFQNLYLYYRLGTSKNRKLQVIITQNSPSYHQYFVNKLYYICKKKIFKHV